MLALTERCSEFLSLTQWELHNISRGDVLKFLLISYLFSFYKEKKKAQIFLLLKKAAASGLASKDEKGI